MSVEARSRSLWKVDYLRKHLKTYDGFIPIITITETWVKSYISKAQLNIPSYTLHRCDRESRTRGGCITYIHESISTGEDIKFDNKFCEVIIVPLEKAKPAVINVYRPPQCSSTNQR